MNIKKLAAVILTAAVLLSGCNIHDQETIDENNRFLSYDFGNVPKKIQLNENPDTSGKELPKAFELADYMIATQLSEEVTSDSKIIIAAAKEKNDYYYSPFGRSDIDEAMAEKTGGFGLAKGNVTTVEILYAFDECFSIGDEIEIFSPGEQWGVGLEEGKEYLVVVDNWKDIYKCPNGDSNIYEIDENFSVSTKSAFTVPSMLDTLSLAEAVSALGEAIENSVF